MVITYFPGILVQSTSLLKAFSNSIYAVLSEHIQLLTFLQIKKIAKEPFVLTPRKMHSRKLSEMFVDLLHLLKDI